MGDILQPGFLYWDGFKYILSPGTVGPQGPRGPQGTVGPQGPQGPQGLEWQTIVDFDFTTQNNRTIGSNGNVIVGGLIWNRFGAANDASPLAIVNGTGLVIAPNGSAFWLTGSQNSFPGLFLPFSSLIFPKPLQWDHKFRIWTYFATDFSSTGPTQVSGVDVSPSGGFLPGSYGPYLGRGSTTGGSGSFILSEIASSSGVASGCGAQSSQTINSANRVLVQEFTLAPVNERLIYESTFGSGTWPDLSATTPLFSAINTNTSIDVHSVLSGMLPTVLGAFVGSTGNATAVRLKIDWNG